MIESYLRPRLFRAAENVALVLSLCAYTLLGTPVLNLSVGRCQTKISTALRMMGVEAGARGRLVALPRSRYQRHSLARALRRLTRDDVNISLAGQYLAEIIRNCAASQWGGMDARGRRDFIQQVSAEYTGMDLDANDRCSPSYADVLYAVVESLSHESLPEPLVRRLL
jgi:hypothetical protein